MVWAIEDVCAAPWLLAVSKQSLLETGGYSAKAGALVH